MTPNPAALSLDDRKKLQTELKDAGYYTGAIDGIWGPKSATAWKDAKARQVAQVPATPVAGLSQIQRLILDCLLQYVGLVEIVPNRKWADPHNPGRAAAGSKLARALVDLGCEPGWAYCITAARAVWKEAYADAGRAGEFASLDKQMSVSVMGSFNALREAGLTTTTPAVGAILFLQHIKNGAATAEGHAAVVTEIRAGEVVCVGFNTSPAAGDAEHERNGDGVYAGKRYPLDFKQARGGLLMRGFLNPV